MNSVKYVYNSEDRGLVELLSTGTTNLEYYFYIYVVYNLYIKKYY